MPRLVSPQFLCCVPTRRSRKDLRKTVWISKFSQAYIAGEGVPLVFWQKGALLCTQTSLKSKVIFQISQYNYRIIVCLFCLVFFLFFLLFLLVFLFLCFVSLFLWFLSFCLFCFCFCFCFLLFVLFCFVFKVKL